MLDLPQADIQAFADAIIGIIPPKAIKAYKKSIGASNFEAYQDDPVGFGEKVLGETYTDDVKRMMESVRDNVITIAKSSNATGKSHGAARVAIWWYKVFQESQVWTGAAPPEQNLKSILWGEIGSIVQKHPELFKDDKTSTLKIQRSPLDFIQGQTIPSSGTAAEREAKFSGKHRSNLLFVLDEGDAIPDDIYRGIESCMTGGNVRLLVMYNPRAEAGEVYRMERDGLGNVISLSAFNHPNVITGTEVIPGAVTRETTVRRINEWCRPLTDDEPITPECFNLPDFLVGTIAKSKSGANYEPLRPGHYKVMNPAFSYMVLGRYPAQGSNALISKAWIAAARTRWDTYVAKHGERPPEYTIGVMGQDVAEMGQDKNVSCFRYGGYVERFTAQWDGVDLIRTGERASAEYKSRKLSLCNVDGTGVGAGVAPHMCRNGCSAVSVKVASAPTYETEIGKFYQMRDQLWWSCREWLRSDPGSMLPPDEELIEELSVPTYEVKNGKIKVMDKDTMRELLKRSPDKADALCLTFYEGDLLYPGF